MAFDLVLRGLRLDGIDTAVDLAIASGRIAAIGAGIATDGPEERFDGCIATPGLVESHIHLDKSHLLDRCPSDGGTLRDAIERVAAAKCGFTEADVAARATRTLDAAILQGTTVMRSQVEVDPRVGLVGYHAVDRLRRDYAHAIDLELCVFPQEGLTNDLGCEELLVAALREGAAAIGGAPYVDPDPEGQLATIFRLARDFDVDVDLHLDFDLDPSSSDMDTVCRMSDAQGWGGRVTIAHATKLSAMTPAAFETAGRRLAGAGIAVTALPATDLFLNGRGHAHSVPRGVAPVHRLQGLGVTASIASNNVLNPFTPYGDCSLLRMANLYANLFHLGADEDLARCFDLVCGRAAAALRRPEPGLTVGAPADIVIFDAASIPAAVRTIAAPLAGWKRGRRVFNRPRPDLVITPALDAGD